MSTGIYSLNDGRDAWVDDSYIELRVSVRCQFISDSSLLACWLMELSEQSPDAPGCLAVHTVILIPEKYRPTDVFQIATSVQT